MKMYQLSAKKAKKESVANVKRRSVSGLIQLIFEERKLAKKKVIGENSASMKCHRQWQ